MLENEVQEEIINFMVLIGNQVLIKVVVSKNLNLNVYLELSSKRIEQI